MNHPFGWDLPPGVRLSDPGGPDDPTQMAAEAAELKLWEALYQAHRAGFTVADINRIWAEAVEEANADDEADQLAEAIYEAQQDQLAQHEEDIARQTYGEEQP